MKCGQLRVGQSKVATGVSSATSVALGNHAAIGEFAHSTLRHHVAAPRRFHGQLPGRQQWRYYLSLKLALPVMMHALRIRQPYNDPAHPGCPSTTVVRKIKIRHPGYDDPTAILLQFDAFDADCGIHYQTAHTACAIVIDSDNKRSGYFSTDIEGLQRVEPSTPDALLVDDTYYFHVPGDKRYAVIIAFADWPFPHDDLPAAWRLPPSAPSFPIHLRADRDRCSMTRSTIRLETAHIVPANPSDVKWWNDNGMSQYGEHNSTKNTIRFKVDVHQVFDRKHSFAIVPKNNTLVAHFFRTTENAAEAVREYHNVPLQFLEGVQMEFLFARLAWTVFPYLEIFLSSGKRRKTSRIGKNGVRIVEEMDGNKCYQFYAQSRARSSSPRKRNIDQVNPVVPGGGDGICDDEPAMEDDDDKDQQRGRKRKRPSIVSFTSTSSSRHLCRSAGEISASSDASLLASLQT